MYLLMNKNEEVARFEQSGEFSGDYHLIDSKPDKLPIGFPGITAWLENRKGSKHNSHLKRLMQLCGCERTEGFIKLTHATSLNDTFWVKSEDESAKWKDVSLYSREFNEVVSKLAFEGVGLYGVEFSSTSPEMSTEGSFRKCWRREDGEIFLYKRGSSGARNTGLEPYGEVMASELAKILCKNSVPYNLCRLHGEIASKCKLFTSEKIGYVPFSLLAKQYGIENNLSNILKYFESIGSEDAFRRMLMLDSITFNVDRHMGNYGVLVDNDSLKIHKMANVFDLNLAMLPYVEKDEFDSIGDKLLGYAPRIGEDFTRTAQIILTPSIRSDLINLKGFHFSFRGDENYPEWRVKKMEDLINRQIEAILSKEKLYTENVFAPKEKAEPEVANKKDYIQTQETKADMLTEAFVQNGIVQREQIQINDCDDHLELNLILDKEHTCVINLKNDELSIEENDTAISYFDLVMSEGWLKDIYMNICRILDESIEKDANKDDKMTGRDDDDYNR